MENASTKHTVYIWLMCAIIREIGLLSPSFKSAVDFSFTPYPPKKVSGLVKKSDIKQKYLH